MALPARTRQETTADTGAGDIAAGLLADPECLGDAPGRYSVFRLRYGWGTVYELAFSDAATTADRAACWGLLPRQGHFRPLGHQRTDTLGVGGELTRRVASVEAY